MTRPYDKTKGVSLCLIRDLLDRRESAVEQGGWD
jgi:hypothetical protein